MLKSEEAENVLLVEKKENKQLRARNGELEVMNKSMREKLTTNSAVDSQLKLLIDENNKLKVFYFVMGKKHPFRTNTPERAVK